MKVKFTSTCHSYVSGSQGILCPKPVINVYGKLYSIEIINNEKHIVRLLEFIPGQMFHEIPHTKNLFYQAGEYIAKFDNALKVSLLL